MNKKAQTDVPAPLDRELTDSQLTFVEALANDPRGNATAAARAAGYAHPSTSAYELLHLPRYAHVQAMLDRLTQARLAPYQITDQKIWDGIAAIAFGDRRIVEEVKSWEDVGKLWPEQAALIKKLSSSTMGACESLSIEMESQLEALRLLAKMRGLLRDQLDLTLEVRHKHEAAETLMTKLGEFQAKMVHKGTIPLPAAGETEK